MELSTETLKKLSEYQAETLRGRGGHGGGCTPFCDGLLMIECNMVTVRDPWTGNILEICECTNTYQYCPNGWS
jgi:hypothetical protein